MSDIEALAKRIILIGKGQILYDGNLHNLKKKYGNIRNVIVDTKDTIDNIKMNGLVTSKKTDTGYLFQIDINNITISKFLKYLSENYYLDDVEIENENIDDIIIKLYKEFEI